MKKENKVLFFVLLLLNVSTNAVADYIDDQEPNNNNNANVVANYDNYNNNYNTGNNYATNNNNFKPLQFYLKGGLNTGSTTVAWKNATFRFTGIGNDGKFMDVSATFTSDKEYSGGIMGFNGGLGILINSYQSGSLDFGIEFASSSIESEGDSVNDIDIIEFTSKYLFHTNGNIKPFLGFSIGSATFTHSETLPENMFFTNSTSLFRLETEAKQIVYSFVGGLYLKASENFGIEVLAKYTPSTIFKLKDEDIDLPNMLDTVKLKGEIEAEVSNFALNLNLKLVF